jgi:MoaA/NifB/PqqE/SkfB family radical SAM enzyme
MLLKKAKGFIKLKSFIKHLNSNGGQIGSRIRGMIINYDNRCNFQCQHCFTRSAAKDSCSRKINIQDVKRVCDELDVLGGWELDIQGGEPLIFPDLATLIKAIGPERFDIVLTTNGWYMTREKAHELCNLGVDRVAVSLDSFIVDQHDKFRGMPGSYSRAMKALGNIKAAGMVASINYTVGHHNVFDKSTEQLCNFAKEHDYVLNFIPLTPTGCFCGNFKYMLQPKDSDHLEQLRLNNSKISRDLWNYFEDEKVCISGCASVNILYLNPRGDVLPCPFIHVKLGNILKQSLKEIVEAGFDVKYFRDYSRKCLAGEDFEFIQKYLNHKMSILEPTSIKELELDI